MPINPNFSIGQNPLAANIVVATDTSTGSDGAITQRRIFIQDANGNYIVPAGTTTDYTEWVIGNASISLNVLSTDIAALVIVQWLDVDNAVLYTLSQQFCFSLFNKQFLYYLVQLQGLKPAIPMDSNYNSNMALFWATILGAENAITINSDIAASQACLDRATYMRNLQNIYF